MDLSLRYNTRRIQGITLIVVILFFTQEFPVRRICERSLGALVFGFDHVICCGGNLYSASSCTGRSCSWAAASSAISPSPLSSSSPLPSLEFYHSDSHIDIEDKAKPQQRFFCWAFVCCEELAGSVFDDVCERFWIEAGSADQSAVDIFEAAEAGGVVGFD